MSKRAHATRYDHLDSPYAALAAAVMRRGLMLDGPDYMTFPCGQWWADVTDLEAKTVYDLAAGGTSHACIPFKLAAICNHLPTDYKARKNHYCRHRILAAQITRESGMTYYRDG